MLAAAIRSFVISLVLVAFQIGPALAQNLRAGETPYAPVQPHRPVIIPAIPDVPASVDRAIKAALLWNESSFWNDPERDQAISQALSHLEATRLPEQAKFRYAAGLYREGYNDLAQGQRMNDKAEAQAKLLEAKQALSAVHNEYPTWSYPLGYLAETEIALGELQPARKHLIQELQLDPYWSMVWHELGFLFAKDGDKTRSLGCFLLAYGCAKDTDSEGFDLFLIRYGVDRSASQPAEEANRRILMSELTCKVKCDLSYTESSSIPSDGNVELVAVKPGIDAPLRNKIDFIKDRKGLLKPDLSKWLPGLFKDLICGGVSTRTPNLVNVSLHLDRQGHASDFWIIHSTVDERQSQLVLSALKHSTFRKLPPGVSDIELLVNVYYGQPLPPGTH